MQSALDSKVNNTTFNDLFEKVNIGTASAPTWAVKVKYNLFSIGEVSAHGAGSGSGGEAGLIETVYESGSLGGAFSNATLTDTFNAYTINKIHTDFINHTHTFTSLTGKPTTLSGYGITDGVLNTDIRLTNSRPASDVYPWAKAVDKPSYSYGEITGTPPTADLSNYVTLSAAQTITGQKTFTAGIWLNHTLIADTQDAVSLYTKEFGGQGLNLRSLLVSADYSYRQYVPDQGAYFVGDVKAYSFVKHNGNRQQLLRADGGVADFIWSGQSGQPDWLWGGNSQHDYRVYNPANFRVANANTVGDVPSSSIPYGNTPTATTEWVGNASDVRKSGFYRANNTADFAPLFIHSSHSSSDYAFQIGTGYSDSSSLEYRHLVGNVWGQQRVLLDHINWYSITDGRYLPLTGGTLSGDVLSTGFFRTTA